MAKCVQFHVHDASNNDSFLPYNKNTRWEIIITQPNKIIFWQNLQTAEKKDFCTIPWIFRNDNVAYLQEKLEMSDLFARSITILDQLE